MSTHHILDGSNERTINPAPKSIDQNSSLADILVFARLLGASDVHITPNNPVVFRKNTFLIPSQSGLMQVQRIESILKAELPAKLFEGFEKSGDLEFVHTIKGIGRYRMTVIRQRFGIDITARIIPTEIMSFEETKMPEACKQLTNWAQGLVLVTGPAGCGKTTTMAALIDFINHSRHDHIITIENPIEYLFIQDKCQITQREIGKHTTSQANALRAALRQDPDIIVVSELRDLDTIQLAVTAAETGHLVFGTMNTNDAAQTISKLIFSFPSEESTIITNMISESLRGVISQRLIPTADGDGVALAYEVLIVNEAVSNMIRTGKFQQINNAIAMGKGAGMVLLDHSLMQLVNSGTIKGQEAYLRAINQKQFEQYKGI